MNDRKVMIYGINGAKCQIITEMHPFDVKVKENVFVIRGVVSATLVSFSPISFPPSGRKSKTLLSVTRVGPDDKFFRFGETTEHHSPSCF